MMEFFSASTTSRSTHKDTPVNPTVADRTSGVSRWLIHPAYLIGHHFLLPLFFGEIKIIGQENIPKTGAVILAPTHRSRWDSLLLPYCAGRLVTGRDMRFMVTSSECQGLQGWFILRMGGFAVDIKRPAIASLRHAVELLQRGEMLVIFPEGGIFRDGKLHPLKPGIARLALNAQSAYSGRTVKIVPISIKYSEPYPSWGADVNIHIGEPIKVTDYMKGCLKLDAKNLTADLTNQLSEIWV